jgi:hypothetical protein
VRQVQSHYLQLVAVGGRKVDRYFMGHGLASNIDSSVVPRAQARA